MNQLSEEEKEALEIRGTFDALDLDKDGKVAISEIVNGTQIHGFNLTSKEASETIAELGINGNGYVDFHQYEMFMKNVIEKKAYEQRLFKTAFRKFDKDGNGSVSYEELKAVFAARGKSEKDVKDFFDEADLNKDGQVDYDEFVEWFSKT